MNLAPSICSSVLFGRKSLGRLESPRYCFCHKYYNPMAELNFISGGNLSQKASDIDD